MKTIDALGFIEVYGFVASIEVADAMLKGAQVRLLRQHGVHPGMITLVVEGDLGSCRAAVDAGVAAAERLGAVIASNIIARPDADTETMVLKFLAGPPSGGSPTPEKSGGGKASPSPAATEALAKPAVGKKAAAQERTGTLQGGDFFEQVMTFIAEVAEGRSWPEIAKRFPRRSKPLRKILEAGLASGRLVQFGGQYRKPGEA